MEILSQATSSIIEIHQSLKVNTDELKKHSTLLESVRENVCREHEKQSRVKTEVATVERKVYILQEDILMKDKQCEQLEEALKKTLRENTEKSVIFSHTQRQGSRQSSEMDEYRANIERCMQTAGTYTEGCHGNEVIQELTRQVERLTNNKEEVDERSRSAEVEERTLREELLAVERELGEATESISRSHARLEATRNQERSKSQRVCVLRKRNEAQLTRLQRQIREYSQTTSTTNTLTVTDQ